MASFNSINGVKMHGNRDLLTGVLRDEFGFKLGGQHIAIDEEHVLALNGQLGNGQGQIDAPIQHHLEQQVFATVGRHQLDAHRQAIGGPVHGQADGWCARHVLSGGE